MFTIATTCWFVGTALTCSAPARLLDTKHRAMFGGFAVIGYMGIYVAALCGAI